MSTLKVFAGHFCVPKQQGVSKGSEGKVQTLKTCCIEVGAGSVSLNCLSATINTKTTRRKVTTTNMPEEMKQSPFTQTLNIQEKQKSNINKGSEQAKKDSDKRSKARQE